MKWLILLIPMILLSGCVDRTGYEECKNSYDNIKLEGGWRIINHDSDFVCCAENRYFVVYEIQCYANCTVHSETKRVCGFIYDSENDELIYSPDGLTPELPSEVLGYW